MNYNVDDIIKNKIKKRIEPPLVNNEDNDVKKRVRKLKLIYLKYFSKIGVKDGKEKVRYNACGQENIIHGSKIGTSR